MNTAGKVAGGSALIAVPATATTVAVYKDEIFGSSKSEEDTYWKFFYFLLMNKLENNKGSNIPSSWEALKQKCKNWTVATSDKHFMDINSENCAVVAAFNNSMTNSSWGEYLGYYEKFKLEKWEEEEDKRIDYSDNSNNQNHYKKLFAEFEKSKSSIAETDNSKAKSNDWNPSKE